MDRAITSGYLAAYNISLFLAWATVLWLTLDVSIRQHDSNTQVYRAVELPLMLAQTAAIMEVLHSVVGLVRSPVAITAMQVASRLWLVWGIIVPVKGATLTGAVKLGQVGDRELNQRGLPVRLHGVSLELSLFSLLVAWSCSELIRYSFFALKELGSVPYASLWLRYTAFIVLYPVGVASELTMVWLALPAIKASGMLSYPMPNVLNFGIDYFTICVIISLVYIPGLPHLYLYMLKQRNKMLGPAAVKVKQQ